MATILIVDDDEGERMLLQTVLEGDHELRFAPNGRVAEEIVRRERIDLVVTDLAMPEVNGLRLIRDLREWGETMPIIAISGVAPEQLDLAQDYGAGIVLFKPVHKQQFLTAVARCLDGGQHWDVWGPRA
jgi:CheY-like chemotaxis protein